jgi:hypothetical protein
MPGPLAQLIQEIGKAAATGWPQTARLAILLATVGTAIAIIVAASR